MTECNIIRVYTIGFVKKNAKEFFEILKKNGIKKIIDIRLNNNSQLAGFTKKEDLEYFLKEIANIDYKHMLELAPTKEILDGYKNKKINWSQYEFLFKKLLNERKIEDLINIESLNNTCFLCSELTADNCHRRLVVEYLKEKFPNINIIHL